MLYSPKFPSVCYRYAGLSFCRGKQPDIQQTAADVLKRTQGLAVVAGFRVSSPPKSRSFFFFFWPVVWFSLVFSSWFLQALPSGRTRFARASKLDVALAAPLTSTAVTFGR